MIHSLSGGVISENGRYTFVKTELDGMPCWYLSPVSSIKVGDRISVPFGRAGLPREAVVLRVLEADRQCAPCPMNHIREIYEILS